MRRTHGAHSYGEKSVATRKPSSKASEKNPYHAPPPVHTVHTGRSTTILVLMRRCRIPSGGVSVRRAVGRNPAAGLRAPDRPPCPPGPQEVASGPRQRTSGRKPGTGDADAPEGT